MRLFLNKNIEKEVYADKILYIAWCLRYSKYDADIDPLHNPNYIQASFNNEIVYLQELKKALVEINSEWEKI